MCDLPTDCDLILLEDAVWLLTQHTNNPAYDFAFDSNFSCRRPWQRPKAINVAARVGAPANYDALYDKLADCNVQLINSPNQHRNASELPEWYPCIEDITPRSVWYDSPPHASVIADTIGWPVFVKGARQTSRHDPGKSIAHDATEYERLVNTYFCDAILKWQRCVVREFVRLRPVKCDTTIKIRPSFEFRTFWWQGQLVGAGPYWSSFSDYFWTDSERDACIIVAKTAADRVHCPFLVIDMAQTTDGAWIVIECNDAQESGYAGVSPFALWNAIIALNRGNDKANPL